MLAVNNLQSILTTGSDYSKTIINKIMIDMIECLLTKVLKYGMTKILPKPHKLSIVKLELRSLRIELMSTCYHRIKMNHITVTWLLTPTSVIVNAAIIPEQPYASSSHTRLPSKTPKPNPPANCRRRSK